MSYLNALRTSLIQNQICRDIVIPITSSLQNNLNLLYLYLFKQQVEAPAVRCIDPQQIADLIIAADGGTSINEYLRLSLVHELVSAGKFE
jgi:hypothetical protein